MNARLLLAVTFALACNALSQGSDDDFQTPALLVSKENEMLQRVWLVKTTKTAIRYRETEVATSTKDARIADFSTIFIQEPPDFAKAIDLYQARKYREARALFASIKQTFSPVSTIKDNPSTLAAFYEMECLRKLDDLDGLAKALREFDKSPITRSYQLKQIETYLMWDAVRSANWPQVEAFVEERAKSRLPGDQRAQLAYALGLAHEAGNRPNEALNAYHTAMVADSGASEELAGKAALKVLGILTQRPEVIRAMKIWGTPEEVPNSPGYNALVDAGAVARLYTMSLGSGQPLPDEFKDLPNYRPKEDQAN